MTLLLSALIVFLATAHAVFSGGPAMGWSSFNYFKLVVNESIYRSAADALVASGLSALGYVYVNTDDAVVLAQRDSEGNLVPDPSVWPSGIQSTIDYVHARGLRFGIYTARAVLTCGKRAASCGFEMHDAAWYATHEIDYVKDDACGPCGNDTSLESYTKMQNALWATGRPFVLAVEGSPPLVNLTNGGAGNSSRVGADIRPTWGSIVGLIDAGSGMWPYAGGTHEDRPFYNDFDILEVGNGDFDPSAYLDHDPQGRGLIAARMHFAFWCSLKSPLLLGNDVAHIDPATLSIVSNADALNVSQDAARAAVRRLQVSQPRDATLGATPWDAVAVVARCNSTRPTQTWRWLGGGPDSNASLTTTDANGTVFCLLSSPSRESYVGSSNATACSEAAAQWAVLPFQGPPDSDANFTIVSRAAPLWWMDEVLGSGPHPHTQYAIGAGTPKPWAVSNFTALTSSAGSVLRAGDSVNIPDNDLLGNVTRGGDFCLDIVTAGLLEVWAAPLSGDRFVAVLFNRSPSPDKITLSWDDLAAVSPNHAQPGPLFVRDIWEARDAGVFTGSYSESNVPAHGVTFLLLTP